MNTPLLTHAIFVRLFRYKLKAALMGAGIAVGVCVMILMQTFAGGARDSFASFVLNLYPADVVALTAGSGLHGGTGSTSLSVPDIEAVLSSIPEIKDWDPTVLGGSRVIKNGSASVTVDLYGYSERAEYVRRRSVAAGEYFTRDDVQGRANIALIGATTARQLFGNESPVGQTIFIDSLPFEIKGLLQRVGVDPHGNDMDHVVFVPYTTLMESMLRITYVAGASFVVRDTERAEAVGEAIRGVLRERHQIQPGQRDDFSLITPVLIRQMLGESSRTMDRFLPLVVGTIFLVAGVIIVGIMLISIKERAAEIGLRKALGARGRDLESQILLEVIVIAIAAAVVGLFLAIFLMGLGTHLASHLPFRARLPTWSGLGAAVGIAVATGLISAALPAWRAAKLDPIDALR